MKQETIDEILNLALEHNYKLIKTIGILPFLDSIRQSFLDIPTTISYMTEDEFISRTIPFNILHEKEEYEILEKVKEYEKCN